MKSRSLVRTSYQLLLLCIALLVIFYSSPAFASTDCGSIIYVDVMNGGAPFPVEIDDCANPFDLGLVSDEVQAITHAYNGNEFGSGDTLFVDEIPSSAAIVSTATPVNSDRVVFDQLYYHDGNNYVTYENVPNNFIPKFTATGTYILVSTVLEVGGPIFQSQRQKKWFDVISEWLLPVAYAQTQINQTFSIVIHQTAITFNVELKEPEPTGASSVLFLPGIQASRLYKERSLIGEDRLWEPQGNGDVRQLAMTSDGVSIEDVYTRDVVDEIAIPGLGENIYKGFLGFLADLQDEEVIADYQPFAYDWRNSVFAVATQPVKYPDGETKRLLDEVLRLAEDSYTDKVTIVAHSNGGLVAKALLHEYGETALAGKVDKLVMIGTPQLGTPKGIGAMLHGTNQQALGGLVISDAVARDVIQNMPGAYTLLPSAAYFTAISSDAVVLADNSSETASVRGYGSVSSRLALENFMLDVQDTLPDNPTINQPLTLNAQLQQAARAEQDLLDAWQAPEGVEVYEVVGTGLATIRGFEYRSFSCSANPACILGAFMKPYPLFSNNGDETVIAGSAQGYGGDKMTAVINLELANAGVTNINREHADLTESPAVQTFVESVIKYPYLTAGVQVPDFADVSVKYTLIGVHSPVTPRIVTDDGRVIGRVGAGVRKEVPGSQYLELGGSTYLIIPTEVGDYTIELAGTGAGLFTLTIEQLGADNGRTDLALIVASSTPVLQGNLTVRDGAFSTLTIDMDGDGRVDEERTLTGELVLNNEVIVEPISSQSSSATRVRDRSPAAQVLGVATSQGPLIQSDSSTIIAGTLQQLTQVLQQRSYLTEVEVQTLTQLLQAISQFLAEQASAETNQ